jgi:hypothetical protein
MKTTITSVNTRAEHDKDSLLVQATKLDAELDRLRHVIADAKALHREMKCSETLSYCVMCAERWPCTSMVILMGADGAVGETAREGVAS